MSAVQTVSVDSIFSYPAEALITGNVQLDDCLKMGNRILLIERARALMEARNEELEDLNSDLGAQNVQLVLQNAKLFAEKERFRLMRDWSSESASDAVSWNQVISARTAIRLEKKYCNPTLMVGLGSMLLGSSFRSPK